MRKRGTWLIIAGFLLFAGAAVIILHNRSEEAFAGKASAAAVEKMQEMIPQETDRGNTGTDADISAEGQEEKQTSRSVSRKITYPDYVLDPGRAMPETVIDGYAYIGYLELPALGLEIPVQSEWSYPNLRVSACRYFGSAYKNDLVICGHNYFPVFGLLTDVSVGSEVRFTDMDGNVFRYEVAGVELLPPEAVEEMISGGWDLTLFTCTMSTLSRITVRCKAAENSTFKAF